MKWRYCKLSDVHGCEINDLTADQDTVQYIRSPNWPHDYPSRSDCRWTIRSYGAPYIRVKVTNLDLESCCDFLMLFDGDFDIGYDFDSGYATADRNYRDYHSDYNSDFYSSGNVVTIRFTSDSSTERPGFQLEYEAVNDNGETPTGMIAGIVCAGVAVIVCCYCCCCSGSK